MTVLVVEDSAGYLDELSKTLTTVFGERGVIRGVTLVSDVLTLVNDDAALDEIDLALVDLELKGGDEKGAGDLEGRDTVLRTLRERAPWIPVIAVSRWFTGEPLMLSQVSPYGFDMLLPKKFFSESLTYRGSWAEARRLSAINRVAAQTGRTTQELVALADLEPKVECGLDVSAEIARYGGENFGMAIRLADFRSDTLTLDSISPGFSGLSIARLTCQRGARRCAWLLKFGSAIGKLEKEANSHRKMFLDGLTRRLSVPIFWWHPVVWSGVGLIAYEFEEEARSLIDEARATGLEDAMKRMAPAFCELYGGAAGGSVVPRRVLPDLTRCGVRTTGEEWGAIGAFLRGEQHLELDHSATVKVGPAHGDLHSRNIMFSRSGPVFIDFAHYQASDARGVPLLDLAKLLVDSWVFVGEIDLDEIATGRVLERASCRPFLLTSRAEQDERRLFRLAVQAQLCRYQTYPDVPTSKKEEALRALSA